MSPTGQSRVRRVAPSSLVTAALVVVALWFARAGQHAAGHRDVRASEPATARVVAAPTLAEALALARREGRRVAIDFVGAAAPLGEALRGETLCDPLVRAELADGFVHVELDPERESALFRELFGTAGFLASVVLDARGEPLAEHAGFSDAPAYVERLARTREQANAVAAARELVALAPDDAFAWLALAEALERSGHARLAAAAWRSVLAARNATQADVANACERLARWSVTCGDAAAARELLARAHAASSELSDDAARGSGRGAVTAGLLHALERAPRAAIASFELALAGSQAPCERATTLFALADAQRDAGTPRDAVATLARLLDGEFDSTTRLRARDAIVALQTNAHGHVH
ncbi:MAG: hypothetical protein L6Q99_04790 [Planctomycetes bacterium]|nr:hypothetical protein [Planctomycetota bacterium]